MVHVLFSAVIFMNIFIVLLSLLYINESISLIDFCGLHQWNVSGLLINATELECAFEC